MRLGFTGFRGLGFIGFTGFRVWGFLVFVRTTNTASIRTRTDHWESGFTNPFPFTCCASWIMSMQIEHVVF